MGPWHSNVSYLYKSDVVPAGLGPVDVQNTNTYCGFFRTGFHSSGRKQYSERFGSNFANNTGQKIKKNFFVSVMNMLLINLFASMKLEKEYKK
jgi:hypothetical protein